MIPYFLIFFLLLFPVKKRYTNNWCFILLLLFTVIRWDVGWDYRWYYSLAENKELNGIPLFFEKQDIYKYLNLAGSLWYLRNEFFLRFISKVIWTLNLPAQTIIIFYGTITLYFFKKGLDNFKINNKYVWLWFYSFPYFYFSSLSIMRQWAAISIVFFAYNYIKRKELKKYLFFLLIASFFHKTAILMLFLYILQNINTFKNFQIILFIISFFFDKILIFILLNVRLPIISNYSAYIFEKIGLGGTKIYYVILVMYMILLLKFLYLEKKEIYLEKIYNISLIGCFIYVSLVKLGHVGIRMSMYFLIFSLILVNTYTKKKSYRISIFLLSLLLLSSLLISDMIRKGVRSEYVPYQTIFNSKIFIKGE